MAISNFRSRTQQSLSADKLLFFIFLFVVLSVLAQASLLLTTTGKLPPQVPIFYSRPWGNPMLAPPVALWILPLVCVFAFLLNFSLGTFLLNKYKFLEKTLLITSFIIALMTLYDLVKIISLLI